MAARILIVEDDATVRDFVADVLKRADFTAVGVESAEEGLQELRRSLYDALILDLMLPGISGMKMCEILKQDPATARLPIIVLTAQGTERTKVEGLQTGADDYIVKPPSPPELVARLQALLRRVKYAGVPEKVLTAPGLRLDMDRHELLIEGKPAALRPKEFRLLTLLMEKKGRVLPRKVLFEALWGEQVVTEHTLEVHVNNLREKLGTFAACVHTVPGIGYKFEDKTV
jgi:DNA-binding response OmpR family regulator